MSNGDEKAKRKITIPDRNITALADALVLVNSVFTMIELTSNLQVPETLREPSRKMLTSAFQHRVDKVEYSVEDMEMLEQFRRALADFIKTNKTHPMIKDSMENQAIFNRFQNTAKMVVPPELAEQEQLKR
jgi:hypothetical protein